MHDSWRGGHGTVLSSDSLSSTTILLPLFLSFPFLVLLFLFSPLSRVNFQTCTNRLHVSSCRCKYKRMEFNSSIGRCLRYVLWSVSKRVSLRSEERKREHTRAGLVDKFHARWESFSFYARCSPVRIEGGRRRGSGVETNIRGNPKLFSPCIQRGWRRSRGQCHDHVDLVQKLYPPSERKISGFKAPCRVRVVPFLLYYYFIRARKVEFEFLFPRISRISKIFV